MKKEYDLKYMWAYKYDNRYNGIQTHADQAAINVNIWITPDEANLDKDTGGLVIYTGKLLFPNIYAIWIYHYILTRTFMHILYYYNS